MTWSPPPATVTEEQVAALARLAGMTLAPEHLPGVVRNLGILLAQAALLDEAPLDPLVEPAPVFVP